MKYQLGSGFNRILYFFVFLSFVIPGSVLASQNVKSSNIKGYVKEKESGEPLPHANVILKGTNRGATANSDGYFVIVGVPVGKCSLEVHYIGYESKVIEVDNKPEGLEPLQIEMEAKAILIDGVKITAQAEMLEVAEHISQYTIAPRQLSMLPNMGEVDIFRAVQLLPGISGANDAESGLYVRGGTPDQNLILFDGMTIYHVDHFFGFFSAFNANAIKDMQIYKGGFPAEYGGRVSSVVNLTGKRGDMNEPKLGVGANLLSAHLNFETPLPWTKGSFIIAGRRSYTDFIESPLYNSIYNFVTGEDNGGAVGGRVTGGQWNRGIMESMFKPSFYFYDLNAKLTLMPSYNNIFAFSFYNGKDNLDNSQDFSDLPFRFAETDSDVSLSTTDFTKWGNLGGSGSWSYQWNDRLHTDINLAYSNYFSQHDGTTNMDVNLDDSTSNVRGFSNASEEDNSLTDITLKLNSEWHINRFHELKSGLQASQLEANYTSSLNDTTNILNLEDKTRQYSFYAQDNWKISKMDFVLGVRTTYYEETQENYLEPRVSLVYPLSENIKLKGAWGYYYQFIHRIVNENLTNQSRDFWLLADEDLEPTFSEHRIVGLSYENDRFLLSVEGYQKDLDNLIEYSPRFRREADYEDRFFIGTGKAKGLEFLGQLKKGILSGWLSYTLGRVDYRFPAFNDGEDFPASHDRRHEINTVAKLNLGPWTFASTWVYASGNAYTAPESQYFLEMLDGEIVSYIHVGDKNSNRLPDYHRLDLSLSRQFKGELVDSEVGLSVFNVYNHKNVWYRQYNLNTIPISITDVTMLGFTPTLFVQFNLK